MSLHGAGSGSPYGEAIPKQPYSPRNVPAGGIRGSRWSRPARRMVVVVLAVLLVVLTLLLLGGGDGDERDPVLRAGSGGCDEVVTTPTSLNRNHVLQPSELDYTTAGPPSFGPHLNGTAPFGRSFYTAADRPEIGNLVHSLEHGFTIVWYDDTAAAVPAAMAALREIARDYEADGVRFIVAPWTAEDGQPLPEGRHFALTRWTADAADPGNQLTQRGNWMYCGGVDEVAIEAFVQRWPNEESPEPGVGLPESTPV